MPEDNAQTLEMSGTPNDSADTVGMAEGKAYSEDEVQNLLKALKSEREARKIYEKEVKEKAAQLEKFAQINPEE